MTIDWKIVAQIATAIGLFFLGKYFEKRASPKLIAYFVHVSTFNIRNVATPTQVYAHSIIVKNVGRRTSNNVRITHQILPEFNIFPDISYTVTSLPNGSQEILIPTLIPNEEITISYLYFPPTTAGQVHAGIKSDEGFAKQIPVALQQQLSKGSRAIIYFLFFAGVCSVIYALFELIRHYFFS
jgi:hypothetical protein